MPDIASKRWSFIGELFTHSGGVLLLVVSFKPFFADLHVVSVASERRLTFSSQLRQIEKMPNRGHSTTKLRRSAVCYAGREGAEGHM